MSAQTMPFAASSEDALISQRQQRDLNACVDLMRGGSKTFFAASRLLPARMRTASIALYAFAAWPMTLLMTAPRKVARCSRV